MRPAAAFALASLFTVLAVALAGDASAFNPAKKCGTNSKCRVVDVIDRVIGNVYSNTRVTEAWNQLRDGGCGDVTNVVVGGTFGENGAPEKRVPAGFAEHVKNRCSIVVHYELEGPVVDAQAYEDSTLHGRRALAIVLARLGALRSAAGKTGKLRVWGHSKGAAIVESLWTQEARKDKATALTADWSVDACPAENCFYFGFGYPYRQERANRFVLSRATALLWSESTDGYITKPASTVEQWWRLTTFSNLDDPIYECTLACAWDLVFNSHCHRYEKFLRDKGYSYFEDWNEYTSTSSRPAPVQITSDDGCGP